MTEPVVAARAPARVTLEAGKDYWLRACEHSHNKPLCDGTHKTFA
jgi:CDGSH-type Zn-finger protein